MTLPVVSLENLWEEFPITKNQISCLLLSNNYKKIDSATIEKWVADLDIKSISCNEVTRVIISPSKSRRTTVRFDRQKPQLMIETMALLKQETPEFNFAVCNKLAQILIGYELQRKLNGGKKTISFVWASSVLPNTEQICNHIAEILLLKKPLC